MPTRVVLITPKVAAWLAKAAADADYRQHYSTPPGGRDAMTDLKKSSANTGQSRPLAVVVTHDASDLTDHLLSGLPLGVVSKLTGRSTRQLTRDVAGGRLRAIPRGRQKIVPLDELERYLRETA